MKKVAITLLCATVLAVALVGCGNTQAASSAGGAAASGAGTSTSAAQVGMANPWSDVASAQEAAEGAGFDNFVLPENGTMFGNGSFDIGQYRCMDGIAQAEGNLGAAVIMIRKGTGGEPDISGDYNEYAHQWTVDANGIEVACSGNEEGRATKSLWSADGYEYCILATAQGDDPMDFGLEEADLITLVNTIK